MAHPLSKILLAAALLPCSSAIAQDVHADWAFFDYGDYLGVDGLEVSTANGVTECIVSFGRHSEHSWAILRHDANSGTYLPDFVSPVYVDGIGGLVTGDFLAASGPEIAVMFGNGKVEIWNQATRHKLRTVETRVQYRRDFAMGDVDADGYAEIVITENSSVHVFNLIGFRKWKLDGVGGYQITIAQLDADPQHEIVLGDGHVIDGVSQAIQWSHDSSFGQSTAADIDADGMDELICCPGDGHVRAFDVNLQKEKWAFRPIESPRRCAAANVDADATIEIIVARDGIGSNSDISAYDGVTRLREWSVPNPDISVANIALGDLDGDGSVECVWSGFDRGGRLMVAHGPTQTVEWTNVKLDAPFLPPQRGDVDGDGQDEIVTVSTSSDKGYGPPGAAVFSVADMSLEHLAEGMSGSRDSSEADCFRLVDVDGDGDQELAIEANSLSIFDWDSVDQAFKRIWDGSEYGAPPIFGYTFEIADLDGDGKLELVTGQRTTTVYDFATKTKLWESFYLGDRIVDSLVANTDTDPALEIHMLTEEGHVFVFDGQSHEPEAALYTLTDDYTSLRSIELGGQSVLLCGTRKGSISAHVAIGGAWMSIGPTPLTDSRIYEFWTLGTSPWAVIGEGGRLAIYYGGSRVWQSQYYGFDFGRGTMMVPEILGLITSSDHGLAGFFLR